MQIAFYKGRTRLFNRLVSWYLRGAYSHCELVLGTSGGIAICASSSFMDGGVRTKLIELHPDHWDLVEVPGSMDAAFAWVNAHAEHGYDVPGLLGFVWRRTQDSRRRWFCSEAVAAMLGYADPWRFDPCTLHAAVTHYAGPSAR